MIHLPASVRVYLCLTPCDMRKSFDSLHTRTRALTLCIHASKVGTVCVRSASTGLCGVVSRTCFGTMLYRR
jgi:hypothetical protein